MFAEFTDKKIKFIDEKGAGKFQEEVETAIKTCNVITEHAPEIVDELLSSKDENEINFLKVSSKYSSYIASMISKVILKAIEDDKSVSHLALSNKIKDLNAKSEFIEKFKSKHLDPSVDVTLLDLGLVPVVQSAPNIKIDSKESKKDILQNKCINIKTGCRYSDYYSFIVRTIFIDPKPDMLEAYRFVSSVLDFVLEELKPGTELSTVYKKYKEFVEINKPEWNDMIQNSIGCGIGLNQDDSFLRIESDNRQKVRSGQVYKISIAFENLTSSLGDKYTIEIGETVAVNEQKAEVLTNLFSKTEKDIYFEFSDDDDESEESIKADAVKFENRRMTRLSRNKEDNYDVQKERKIHQDELLDKKVEEIKERFQNNKMGAKTVEVKKKNMLTLKSYNNEESLPKGLKKNKIFVDNKNYSVLLPINGVHVPFHISLIKNVTKTEESKLISVRINFLTPISGGSNLGFQDLNLQKPFFIKELVYKSKNESLSEIAKQIKELQKAYKSIEAEEIERQNIIIQSELNYISGKKPVLRDVIIRPNITQKKTSGTLEGHNNGLRFISNKNDKIDIIYSNIKHAVFQPCENELIAIVHFRLHNPILIQKKKTYDVQFYRETGIQADDLDNKRRGNEYEEYQFELKEIENKNRINNEVKRFAQQIEEISKLKFDVPYRQLAFYGCHHRSAVQMMPSMDCLYSLVEMPFFVVSVTEVELVSLERVTVKK